MEDPIASKSVNHELPQQGYVIPVLEMLREEGKGCSGIVPTCGMCTISVLET